MAVAVLATGCAGCADTKGGAGEADTAEFDQTMRAADSLHNSMQFRDAYDLYLQLLNNPVAKADNEKKLNVLSSLSNASELSGHKAEETKWLQQQLDLAKETGNSYFHAMALVSMGQNIFFEGDRAKGIQYVNEAIDLIAKTDRGNTDHLTHGFLNLLTTMYSEMKDYDSALLTCEHNLQLTMQGTRWGAAQNQQLIDRRIGVGEEGGSAGPDGN
jgi:tetratricopeptide (TPR) repeat protein